MILTDLTFSHFFVQALLKPYWMNHSYFWCLWLLCFANAYFCFCQIQCFLSSKLRPEYFLVHQRQLKVSSLREIVLRQTGHIYLLLCNHTLVFI